MRSKTILSIAAFVIAFSFSVVLASFFVVKSYQTTTYGYSDYSSGATCSKSHRNIYQSATAKKIAAFIQADKENGYERDRKIFGVGKDFRPPFEDSSFPDYVEVVEEYVDASSSLDESELPLKFQAAWREHIKTWQDYSEFLNEMKSSSKRKNAEMKELLSEDNHYSADINRTWYEVLHIAETQGADVR